MYKNSLHFTTLQHFLSENKIIKGNKVHESNTYIRTNTAYIYIYKKIQSTCAVWEAAVYNTKKKSLYHYLPLIPSLPVPTPPPTHTHAIQLLPECLLSQIHEKPPPILTPPIHTCTHRWSHTRPTYTQIHAHTHGCETAAGMYRSIRKLGGRDVFLA